MNEQYLDFYDRVKDLLKLKNVTLIDTLKKLGINLDAYKSCKRYGNLPRADEVYLLAQELNTSVEYLVTGKEPKIKDRSADVINAIRDVLEQFS